jgi:hypothetical protein
VRSIGPLFLALIGSCFFTNSLTADSITIATGETITATIGLTQYEEVCSSAAAPPGGCPTFPVGLLPSVLVDTPVNNPDLYSLDAELVSTNDGDVVQIGSLPLEISSPFSLFRYNEGYTGFLFPDDPTFFGPDPSEDTFEVVFQNTGAPFTLSSDDPVYSAEANLDSSETGPSIRVAEDTISVTFSQVPEPNSLFALAAMLAGLVVFRRTKRRA